MISRNAEHTMRRLLLGFPIVTLTGPRQSGKTTLAKSIFTDRPYVSLEDPDIFSNKPSPFALVKHLLYRRLFNLSFRYGLFQYFKDRQG